MAQVYTTVIPVQFKEIHGKSTIADKISFSDLEQRAKLGNTIPRSVQEFARERVQDNVDTSSLGHTQHILAE
jgi:hypothetical protein